MNIAFSNGQIAESLIVPIYNELEVKFHISNQSLAKEIQDEIKAFNLVGNNTELHAFKYSVTGQIIILAGLGHILKIHSDRMRKAFAKGLKKASSLGHKSSEVILEDELIKLFDSEQLIRSIGETVHLSLYNFNKFISGSKPSSLEQVLVKVSAANQNLEALNEGDILGQNALVSCNLINEPANNMYPETLANAVVELGAKKGFEVEVFDEKQCEALGLKALLAVGRASNQAPRLIVMRWKGGQPEDETLGLIGKGVTYDTGGLSLKSTEFMAHMKSDMSGSAVSIGAMCSLADMKVAKNVTTVVAACENNVSANAYRPGDIIGSMSGKTIEVLNTDAEGRLTLADAIHYAIEKENVSKIIDIATLTGAVKIALGDHRAGFVTNTNAFENQVYAAAEKADELYWRLPIDDEYRSHVDSEIADIKNTGNGRLAGTISAAAFIEAFIQDKPWIHFDIAGVSYNRNAHDYYQKGATGRGMRMLYHLIKDLT